MAPHFFSKLFKTKNQRNKTRRKEPTVVVGISESTCQVNGDPFDQSKLPVPSPNQRQLQLGQRPFRTQEQSLFFRLPLEIRQLIYLELFGGRRVHIDYLFKGPSVFRPRPQGKYRKNHWQWWHSVCRWSNTFADYFDNPQCYDCSEYARKGHEWEAAPPEAKLAGVEWLQCCQMGFVSRNCHSTSDANRSRYEEALPILYGTNVFALGPALESPFQMSRLLRPDYLSLITSMDIWIGAVSAMKPPESEEGWRKAHPAFWDLFQSTFCNVRQLRLTLHMLPLLDETPDALCASMDSLANSREWNRLELSLEEDCCAELKERAEAQGKWTLSDNSWCPLRVYNCGM